MGQAVDSFCVEVVFPAEVARGLRILATREQIPSDAAMPLPENPLQ
jgi:hypothetical protein